MLLRQIALRPEAVSDAVYVGLVETLQSSLMPAVVSVTAQALAGSVIIWQTGDVIVTGSLSAIGVVIAVVRAYLLLSFRRQRASQPLGLAEAHRCGLRHMAFAVASALVVGLLIARSMMFDDAISTIVAIGVGFAFSNGVIVRLSLLPLIAGASLTAVGLPAILVSVWRGDVPHLVMALLVMIHFVDSFEMVRRTFRSTLNHILLKERFERLARIDPMTGLFNRSVLTSDLPQIVAHDRDTDVAVYAIDLDHFKAANDRFGHPVGDALLGQVAARLTALSGPDNLVIRMGGDEFVLVDPSVASRNDAAARAQRILDAVSAPYVVAGHDIVIGASIGVAMSSHDDRSPEALLSRADKALYQAKVGRGGYVVADAMPAMRPALDEMAAGFSSVRRQVLSTATGVHSAVRFALLHPVHSRYAKKAAGRPN